ncbi:MAG TPA: sulfotransferase [Actinomycetota bacterium]
MSSQSDASFFVIVGAQRCGTTYLYTLLDEHPSIEMARPLRPEPKFFLKADAVARGIDAYLADHFGHRPHARVRGEKGTSYIESEDAARRIAGILPDPKIVVLVRDPIDRAISNYRFSVKNGLETLPIAEALTEQAQDRPYDTSSISASPFGYLRRGRYAEQLEMYGRHIPRERIFVAVLEELVEGGVLAELCAFLGVEPHQTREPGPPVNASEGEKPQLAEADAARLRTYFAPATERLEEFLGRRIESWR